MMTGSAKRSGRRVADRCRAMVSCGLALVIVATPWSTNAFSSQNAVLGSVSAVGAVQLRGVLLTSEGTLFDGDSIRTTGEAYVHVRLADGPRLELGSDTDVQVDRGESIVQVAMRSGRMAFSSPPSSVPVSVSVESLRIRAPEGAAAEVAFLGPNRLSVTALAESLMLTQAAGQEEAPVAEGEQVIIDLDAAVESTDAAPQSADSGAEAGNGSATKVVVISAGAAAGAGTLIFLATRDRDSASQSQP